MVVIIGILAAIAIPKFANTKEKAVVSLDAVATCATWSTAQEAYWIATTGLLRRRDPDRGARVQPVTGA